MATTVPTREELHDALHEVMTDPNIGLRVSRDDFTEDLRFKARNIDSISLADSLTGLKELLAEKLGWEDVPDRMITDEEFGSIETVGDALTVMETAIKRYLAEPVS